MAEGSDVNYWSLVTIIGPLVLLAVIVWLVVKSKSRGVESSTRETEEGTKRLYRKEQEAHEGEPGSGL